MRLLSIIIFLKRFFSKNDQKAEALRRFSEPRHVERSRNISSIFSSNRWDPSTLLRVTVLWSRHVERSRNISSIFSSNRWGPSTSLRVTALRPRHVERSRNISSPSSLPYWIFSSKTKCRKTAIFSTFQHCLYLKKGLTHERKSFFDFCKKDNYLSFQTMASWDAIVAETEFASATLWPSQRFSTM